MISVGIFSKILGWISNGIFDGIFGKHFDGF